MRELVFSRGDVWMPVVVRADGALRLEIGAGADANHDPRRFGFPLTAAHLQVIRADLGRHLLLWSAVLPLCDGAGTRGDLDERAAVALLDAILLGAPADVDRYLRGIAWSESVLVRHGADLELLERGEVMAALHSVTVTADRLRAERYRADRERARRGVRLGPLDAALLEYTGRRLDGARVPTRNPEAVDPALLPEVLRIVAVAEQSCVGARISSGERTREQRRLRKREWNEVRDTVERAVRLAYPDLVHDAVETVGLLLCSEVAARSRAS